MADAQHQELPEADLFVQRPCFEDRHDDCRLTCYACAARCQCPCHQEPLPGG